MIIHTVKCGETLYNIARRYSVPPTKILADNDIDGDRLTVGDELLILIPTRTVTVRGGESRETIAKRFSIRENALVANNPQLALAQRLRPGQVLTVRHEVPTLGVGSALGIFNKGCKRENLKRALPYITYIAVTAGRIGKDGIGVSFDPSFAHDTAKSEGKITLLGIIDETNGEFLHYDVGYSGIIRGLIEIAKKHGMSGIAISAKVGAKKYPHEFCEFLLEARKLFIGCDLILFTDIFTDTPKDASELSDGAVIMTCENDIETARCELSEFAKDAESSKVFVKLKNSADIGSGSIGIDEAKALCYKSGLTLTTDEKSLMSEFVYTRYRTGLGEKLKISFQSLQYTKSMLERLAERGYMGICFDIDNISIAQLCMFNASFRRADYSLPHEL